MRKRIFFIILFLMLSGTGLIASVHAQNLEFKVDKIEPHVIKLSGARDAIYSPSGKFLAIQGTSKFLLLPAQNLNDSLPNARQYDGQIIAFLPSETLVYSDGRETFALEPINQKSRRIFSRNLARYLNDNDLTDRIIVIASNNLIITGDGSYDWGGKMGNIYRYDLKRQKITRGARISGFWYASLSPGGEFILYEHGSEENNNTELYDISQNKSYPISEYFSFKNIFPEYETTDEYPVAWLRNRDRFLAGVNSNDDNGETNEKVWLTLFDVSSRKVIWKKLLDEWFLPSDFQQLDDNRAFLSYANDEGIYELSLENGDLRKTSVIDGKPFAVSPDGKKIAFVKSNRLLVASPDGSNRKIVLDLVSDWEFQTAHKGMGDRSPLWSTDSDSLILFGENQLLIIQLNGE